MNWRYDQEESGSGAPKRKPDPLCPYCKGTGKVLLVFSHKDCDCVRPKAAEPESGGTSVPESETETPRPATADSLGNPADLPDAVASPHEYGRDYNLSYVWNTTGVYAGCDGEIQVEPATPYFEPRAISMIGIDMGAPGLLMRFLVNGVMVGSIPQIAASKSSNQGVLSDIFSGQPLSISWLPFSQSGLGRELKISVFNLSASTINIYTLIWGKSLKTLNP